MSEFPKCPHGNNDPNFRCQQCDREEELTAIAEQLAACQRECESLRTVLDLLRTGRTGVKYESVQSRNGSMVNVEAALTAALAGRK